MSQVALVVGKLHMSHETHSFWKGRQFFILASIATMIASATTITTHHHHQNPSTGKTKVPCIGYRKTFCIDFTTRDSLYFGKKLAFKHVYGVDGYSLQNAYVKLSRVSQLMYINYSRRGKKYTNEAAATDVLNCTEKQELKKSPFVKYFELGTINEGYWGTTIWCYSWKTVLIA
jgi:hypothetical protein